MKTALVYDRVNKWGGAERVLLALHELFPDAPLYTAVYSPKKAPWAKVFPNVIASFIQKIPFAQDRHEHFPYLMPLAFESFNFDEYDLVISVTSEAAKGIITKPHTLHICYCLTPTRYLWSQYDFYFRRAFFKSVTKPIVSYLRYWDRIAAQRPDLMVGISNSVCKRIKTYYGRNSELIYPPVDTDKFQIPRLRQGFGGQANSLPIRQVGKYQIKRRDYFLFVSRLIPYKRADLAIEAFNELGLELIIVGRGSEEKRLKAMANRNIKFVGEVSDKELAGYYSYAQALIFPGEEDFGMVMVEAQAAGTPVLAFRKGGALDIIQEGKTGVFFDKQTKEEIINKVRKFQKSRFARSDLIKNAQKYTKEHFKKNFHKLVKIYIDGQS